MKIDKLQTHTRNRVFKFSFLNSVIQEIMKIRDVKNFNNAKLNKNTNLSKKMFENLRK